MAKYTVYIPEEFFLGELTGLQVLIGLIIILVIIFLGYKFFESLKVRKRPESF